MITTIILPPNYNRYDLMAATSEWMRKHNASEDNITIMKRSVINAHTDNDAELIVQRYIRTIKNL